MAKYKSPSVKTVIDEPTQTIVGALESFYMDDIMNEWECEFYESVTIQLKEGQELTHKQVDKLIELHQRYCASKG